MSVHVCVCVCERACVCVEPDVSPSLSLSLTLFLKKGNVLGLKLAVFPDTTATDDHLIRFSV